jgi:hypothetical protein
MKKFIGLVTTYAGAAVLAASFASLGEAKAQTATPSPAAAQGECSAEAKLAIYNEFRAIFKTEQDKAYTLAKKYLACPTAAGEESIAAYLQEKFVAPMDKARRADNVKKFVYDSKDYAKAFELGKQVLVDEPENLRVLVDLGYAGYPASTKGTTYNQDAINYARKAIQLLEAGRTLEIWDPYTGKDEALGYLNNTLGVLTLQTAPAEALRYFMKAGQLEGKLKKDAITYGNIGDAYTAGPYERLSAEYNAKFKDKDETPESKLALENLNQVIDRIIDAYARAVSLSGSDAASAARKKAWLDTLTGYYKFRHPNDPDSALTAMIAGAMSKPLPPPPTPITTLPTPTPAGTPVSGTPVGAGNGATTPAKPATTPAKPAITTTTTGTAATTSTTKPPTTTATGTTVVKPKPKNNHSKPTTKRRS